MSFTPYESVASSLPGQAAGATVNGSGYLDVACPSGLLLSQGAAENSIKLPTTAAEVQKAIGLSLYQGLKTPYATTGYGPSGADGCQDAAADFVDFTKQGKRYVVTEETIALGDKVFARYAAHGSGKLQVGAFRNDADPLVATVTIGGTYAQYETCTVQVTVTKNGVNTLLPACTATGDANPTTTELSAALAAALVLQEGWGFDVADTDGEVTITPRPEVDSITISVSEASSSGTIVVDDATVENTCAEVLNAAWCSAVSGAGVAILNVNFPG